MAKVLFTTTAGVGHIHPMVPLAAAFRDQGDDVLWAGPPTAAERIEKAGFRAAVAGLDQTRGLGSVLEVLPELVDMPREQWPDYTFTRYFGTILTPPMLDELLPIALDFKPDLLVCEGCELAGRIVAASLEVPNVNHSFGSAIPDHLLEAGAEVVAPFWESAGLTPRPYCGVYDHLHVSIYPPSLRTGEVEHVETQNIRPIPFAGGSEEELPDLVTAGGAPLVYVTFGTVFNWDLSLVSTVLEGMRDLDVRVVITLGFKGEPDSLGPQPPNVHIARYIPQTSLLEHCSLVTSHGGSGTFLASLGEGIPQLCIPQAADQFRNTAACVRAGAGLGLMPGEVSAGSVRQSANRLLTEDGFRRAAGRVKGEIASMPGPDEVAGILRRLA